jgi:type II pantothenate kinase
MTAGPGTRDEVGLDLGATLSKAVVVREGASLDSFETFVCASGDLRGLASFLAGRTDPAVAVTGAGAHPFAALHSGTHEVYLADEFEAWGAGERALLRRADFAPGTPHLLVSAGTGTSILRVDTDGQISRVGGTGLGGGTLRGLATLLLGTAEHDAIAELARLGDRRRVDLLVRDLYATGEIQLHGDLTASNLGKLTSREPKDLASAIVGLVGENVALLAGSLARRAVPEGPVDVVYAGATLTGNVLLRDVLAFVTSLSGATARFLPMGEFVGAAGAIALARSRPSGGTAP